MVEGHRKSFRKYRRIKPGEIAAIIAAIGGLGGLITAFHGLFTPSTNTTTTSNIPNTLLTTTSQSTSNPPEIVCGTQLPGINNLFGSWTWVGTNNDATQSGLFTFKSDCTYTNVPKSGFNLSDNGSFVIIKSPNTSIKLQSKSGNAHTYLINDIQSNSFHLYDLENKVSLDFARIS